MVNINNRVIISKLRQWRHRQWSLETVFRLCDTTPLTICIRYPNVCIYNLVSQIFCNILVTYSLHSALFGGSLCDILKLDWEIPNKTLWLEIHGLSHSKLVEVFADREKFIKPFSYCARKICLHLLQSKCYFQIMTILHVGLCDFQITPWMKQYPMC